jgi:hypothetical protein
LGFRISLVFRVFGFVWSFDIRVSDFLGISILEFRICLMCYFKQARKKDGVIAFRVTAPDHRGRP